MYSAVLIDDEINALKMLELELLTHFDNITILDKFQDPTIAVEQLNQLNPDILFIDIEMPTLNGFDVLEKTKISSQIIFTTAYSEYAINAIKANAIDYLLKPLDTDELLAAVNKAIENINNNDNNIEEILKELKNAQKDIIRIPISNGYAFINKFDIIYCQSESNYTHIITTKKKHLISKTLKFIQNLLPENEFIRIHNSYLVNVTHIKEYSRKDGGYVLLSNNSKLRVSNSKKDIFNQ